jgi:CRISPR-associated protein Cas1
MEKTYYIFNPGQLSRKDNTLKFTPVDADGNGLKPRYLPVEGVDDLYIFGELKTNSPLLNFLGRNQISMHFFDYFENYTGSFMPREKLLSGKMIIEQVKAHTNKKKRLEIARHFIDGAAFNMLKNLKYYYNRGKNISSNIQTIEHFSENIFNTSDIESLMGIEGNIRMNYYDAFNEIISAFEMPGRSKRPPRNEINALISFGNMMCYSQCLRAIYQTQLNPTVSYLHSPSERRYSLALDLAEIFKPVLVDRTIFKVLNKREVKANDFDIKTNRVVLKEKGKKTFVAAFESRLNETIQHKILKRKVSYKYLIKLECYKLIKHIMNIEPYKPFKIWW